MGGKRKMRDIQYERPEVQIRLTRVGCTGIKKQVIRKKRTNLKTLTPTIDVFVELGENQKGIHMSRLVESINSIVEEISEGGTVDFEGMCLTIAKDILKRHEYTDKAEVFLAADLPIRRVTPRSKIVTQEIHQLVAHSVCERGGNSKKSIGCTVVGLNVCPCAQEAVLGWFEKELESLGFGRGDIRKIADAIPIASHNQRVKCTLILELNEKDNIELMDLIEIVESSVSTPIYELLKRRDELEIIINSHKKPMFVEDSVRFMLQKCYKKYRGLDEGTKITARIESFESIHQHNAMAERIATLGELKKELEGNKKTIK